MSSLSITVRSVGDVQVMDCVGDVTAVEGTKSAFQNKVAALLEVSYRRLLVNLRHVKDLDGTGTEQFVSQFAGAKALVESRGGQLKLLGLPPKLRTHIQTMKLNLVFGVFDDENEAVKSFGRR